MATRPIRDILLDGATPAPGLEVVRLREFACTPSMVGSTTSFHNAQDHAVMVTDDEKAVAVPPGKSVVLWATPEGWRLQKSGR